MKSLFLLSLLLLTTCGVYRSNFDCPPGKGIGCAPVGEVLDLIVEKDEGEDIFTKDKGTALLLRSHAVSRKAGVYLIQDETGQWKMVSLSEGSTP